MPYSNIASAPKALRTAGLTLAQINYWSRIYDGVKGQEGVTSPAAVAWTQFKKKYYKAGNTWKIKKSYKGEDIMKPELPKELKGYELLYRCSPPAVVLEDADAEGKVYEKELIREGEWAHPQKVNVRMKVTLKRMKQWVEVFSKSLFKVPIPKRHSDDPEDNRGWLKKLFIKKNNSGINALYGHLDITNQKMQKQIDDGDIQDVSVSVGEYVDNQGKKRGEVLHHVALTVIPHIDKQAGFTPVTAEGYICLEESSYMKEIEDKISHGDTFEEEDVDGKINNQAPDGSKEQEREDIEKAIADARVFPDNSSFYIIGTYEDKVIVQYYGSGIGEIGKLRFDKYFEIPYTKDLKKKFVFGDKKELIKKFYFTPKEIQYSIGAERKNIKVGKNVEKKLKGEVKEMEELELLQGQKVQLEKDKADLENKISELEPEVTTLKEKVTELESVNREKEDKLQAIEVEKKASFEKEVDGKVSKLVEGGHILPASKDEVKGVLLQGGKTADLLEVALKNQKAIDLKSKTKQESNKPNEGDKLTTEQVEKEATRISEGK